MPQHIERAGGLKHGHNPKNGCLRHGHEPKKGGLKNWHISERAGGGLVKKRILVTDDAQKGVLGSLFINYLYFCLVNMIHWWAFALTEKKRGPMHWSGSEKGSLKPWSHLTVTHVVDRSGGCT